MMCGGAEMRMPTIYFRRFAAGVMLLEALIGILIFSIGILALVGMQATSVRQVSSAKYRTDASLLANDLMGQMWLGDRTPVNLTANFSSPSGADYLLWVERIKPVLPGSADHLPSVSVRSVPGTFAPHAEVRITLYWQPPSEPLHQFLLVAEIQ